MEENENLGNHVTTRVKPEIKKTGCDFATKIERKKSWVFAKAIELGLPMVIAQYGPGESPNKKAA